jgi:hypothetical protein
MSTILELDDLSLASDGHVVVDAVIANAVLVNEGPSPYHAQWGPALCRGTFYLSDEDLIPATDAELLRLIEGRVTEWVPVDPVERGEGASQPG